MEEQIKVIKLGYVNAFLIKIKNEFILIDTGMPVHWKILKKELILQGALHNLNLVILTHGDIDHIGNSMRLQKVYNAKIAMHISDYETIKSGIYPKRKIKGATYRIFISAGNIARKIKKYKNYFNDFKPDIFLSDEESLEKYGFNAKVKHIPGHTKGSIGILTSEGNLFVGDTMINRRKPIITTIIEDFPELKNSIEKLKKLDVKMVYPGHGKPFHGSVIREL
jgi:glyoxylase-like metal-dependent hydrolase (beta-lactamase superfamily II)